jgi:hypothetical protein
MQKEKEYEKNNRAKKSLLSSMGTDNSWYPLERQSKFYGVGLVDES